MGLHNKFPSYFYKRGNLFNTYLGYTEASSAPDRTAPVRRRPKRGSSSPSRGAAKRELRVEPDVAAFVSFARQNLTQIEGQILFQNIADRFNVRVHIPDDARLWSGLRYFMSTHTPAGTASKYLTVLEDRSKRGVPLIRSADPRRTPPAPGGPAAK